MNGTSLVAEITEAIKSVFGADMEEEILDAEKVDELETAVDAVVEQARAEAEGDEG